MFRTFCRIIGLFSVLVIAMGAAAAQSQQQQTQDSTRTSSTSSAGGPLSYVRNIAPIVTAACLPCHAAANENPSGLSLDSYEMLLKGGEHGPVIVPGKPEASSFYFKLTGTSTFGKLMPRRRSPLTPSEIEMIRLWVVQGAAQ